MVIRELDFEVLGELIQGRFIISSDFGNSNSGSGLFVDQSTEFSFSSNETVGDVSLSAELGQPEDQFDGVDVVGNDNQLSLLVFNELGDVVKTVLKDDGFLGFGLFTLGLVFSGGLQSLGLFLGSFGSVFLEELEEIRSLILVQSLSELIDRGGDLESGH